MATSIYEFSKDSGLSKPQADAIHYLGKDRLCAFKCGLEFSGSNGRLDRADTIMLHRGKETIKVTPLPWFG